MKAYKLVTKRKNGSLDTLFIQKRAILPIGKWLKAEFHPTKGYAPRFGWHCTFYPYAPHLKEKNRIWVKCEIKNYRIYNRPESQGGLWILADDMKITKELCYDEVRKLREARLQQLTER